MEFRRELVGATTSTLILSVLQGQPTHGYEIVQRVNQESGGAFEWREGTVYPALHKLEKAGLISGDWVKSETGKKRRVYALTDAGTRALKRQRDEWNQYAAAVNKVLEVCHG